MLTENKVKICPRCSRGYADFPALSRRDNKTEICSNCGTEEAMLDMAIDRLPKEVQTEIFFLRKLASNNHFPHGALQNLLDYVYADEERDFNSSALKEHRENHIFNAIERLSVWEYNARKGR